MCAYVCACGVCMYMCLCVFCVSVCVCLCARVFCVCLCIHVCMSRDRHVGARIHIAYIHTRKYMHTYAYTNASQLVRYIPVITCTHIHVNVYQSFLDAK
jgi:hypothetical protein